MKTVFDEATRDELIQRINSLDDHSKAQWGKMNVYQMLKHCTLWEEMLWGRTKYKRALVGRLFGKMALKGFIKDDSPLKRSTPTVPELKVTENGDVAAEKTKWIALIGEHEHFSNPNFVH